MIYLFDREKKLQKIIPRKHIINATQTKVRNGIYQLAVEVPIFYETKQGTHYNYQKSVSKAEFAGHYDDKNRFQLYKIYSRNITANEQGEFLLFDGVHIFFDEAKAMGNIHDRRFRDSEAKAPADAVFNSIGWTVIDYDVTDRHDINFYRASVTDAWNDLISTYGVEFDYELQFDGRKIISKNIIMKKQIGRWTGQRFAYGTNVLTLTQEQDESEVYTAAVGRGRGEEAGDGFGPRLEFGDIAWSKDGITKAVGQNYIELPSATAEYGFIENGIVKPRIAPEVVFEDIEDKKKLADATYYWLIENCVPKATWKTDVARIGNLNLGDTVGVLYKAAGIIKRARVEKIEYNLLDPELSKLTLGDFHHFENRQMKRINAQIKRLGRDNRSLITQVKDEFDQQFSAWVTAFRNEFEQAKIDIFAEIEADRVNMEALLNTKLTEFNTAFNADMEEAYEEAQRNYTEIENYVNTTVDTNRGQVEQIINTAEQSAKEHATQQAIEKSNLVKAELENVTRNHASMIEGLETDVLGVNTFIGSRDRTLDEILNNQRAELEQKIEVYNRNYPNLVIGSTLENIDGFEPYLESEFELRTNESLNYIRTYPVRTAANAYYYPDTVYLEQGKTYTLAFDFRSDVVKDLDYVYFMGPYSNVSLDTALLRNFEADGTWHRYYVTFAWVNTTRQARLMVGTNFNQGDMTRGWFDTRQIHVYEGETHNIPWSPSPSDNAQIVSQLLFEMRRLEDGMSSLATRTDLDLVSGRVEQFTNEFTTTSEQLSSKLQRYDDALGVNGSHFTQIAEQVQSKVWLNDITNINPNLIPFADVSSADSTAYWTSWNAANITSRWIDEFGEYVIRSTASGSILGVQSETFDVTAGEELTFSMIGRTSLNWNSNSSFSYTYLVNENGSNLFLGSANEQQAIDGSRRRSTWRFYANFTGKARILIGTYRLNANEDARFSFKEPKLERGSERTPVLNAFSNIEQLANKIALQVQDLDGEYLSESDLQITPNYWQLGATRIGPENVSSVLRGSPDAIDAIVSKFNLTGNLNVKGQIETISMSAIKAEFADLFAARVRAGSVHADYVEGFAGRFSSLYTLNANIERLVAQNVFTDAVMTKSLDAIEANIGRVRTAFLTSNVIESEHIQVGTALVHKLFAASARIDELITKNHFVTNVKAMSIEAVEGQFSSLMTKYFSANYIDVDYINGKNAWFESQYTLNANIAKLTSQTAFIRDIQTIEVTANQLNIQTLHSKLRGVEGGLTIYGYDGRVLINNSILENTFSIGFIQPRFMGVGVELSANYFKTTNTSYTTAAAFSFLRGGRYLTIEGYCEMRGDIAGAADTTVGAIRLLEYSSGTRSSFTTIESRKTNNGNNQFFRLRLDLGVPQYEQRNFYVQFYTAHSGNAAYFRINQAYYHG